MMPICGSGPLVSALPGRWLLTAPGDGLNFLIAGLLTGVSAGLSEVRSRHVRLAKTWLRRW